MFGFILWIGLSIGIGFMGKERKIGFGGAFILSLLLSPLLGGIITLCSKTLAKQKYEDDVLKAQQETIELLKKQNNN